MQRISVNLTGLLINWVLLLLHIVVIDCVVVLSVLDSELLLVVALGLVGERRGHTGNCALVVHLIHSHWAQHLIFPWGHKP